MSERFETLAPEQEDALRRLKLLTAAGILPFMHPRLEAILEHLFNRTLHLGDCLDSLAAQSFIRRPSRQNPIQPEPAYLQGAVAYINGKTPQDDFPVLVGVLEAMADVEGLFYLGNTYGISLKRNQNAFDMFERALQLRPEYPEAWQNKGVALRRLERYPEALQAYERALQLRPDNPQAWYNKAEVLHMLGRDQEAQQAYTQAKHLYPGEPFPNH